MTDSHLVVNFASKAQSSNTIAVGTLAGAERASSGRRPRTRCDLARLDVRP